MEYLTAALILLGTFVAGIVGNIVASELYHRMPTLAQLIISIAIQRLPFHLRSRFEEEWLAHLNQCEGHIQQIVHAFGCVLASLRSDLTLVTVDRENSEPLIAVVRSIEDLMKVMAIRSAVYIAEECPYAEELDGNDFSATHLICYVGNEPAACARIRWFADFARIDRLEIRPEFRSTDVATRIVRAGFELCSAKGYRRIYQMDPEGDLMRLG